MRGDADDPNGRWLSQCAYRAQLAAEHGLDARALLHELDRILHPQLAAHAAADRKHRR
jgi:hypothetical protein